MASNKIDPRALRIAIAVLAGGVAVILDSTIVSVALHELATDLGAGVGTIQWVSTAYLLALDWHLNPPMHLVVTGDSSDVTADALHRSALAEFAPRRVVRRLRRDEAATSLPPPLQAMLRTGPAARAYACRGTTCSLPAESLDAWRATLASLRPARG